MTEWLNRTHVGDCRDLLGRMATDGVRVQTCVTSPPYYGLRNYGVAGQIGHEESPSAYVAQLVEVFRHVGRILNDDGTLWLNLGDSYAGAPGGGQGKNGLRASRSFTARIDLDKRSNGFKPKDLLGIPWRVAFALQADGWHLRSDVIWHKPNPLPESVKDRPTRCHEYLFLLSRAEHYYYDAEAIAERSVSLDPTHSSYRPNSAEIAKSGRKEFTAKHAMTARTYREKRNRRTVWTITTKPFRGAHSATFPRELIEPCILAGSRPGDTVLDPFMGSGTTAQVATDLGRCFVGCELNPAYVELQDEHRLSNRTIGMPV